jgi:YHS domain-containing protein
MKALLIFTSLLLTNMAVAKPINTGWFSTAAIKGYDSVAYFKEKKAVKGLNSYSHEWGGATWNFSSKENLEAFKTTPEKYAPQYGGYCAYAMKDGKKVNIDPNSFDIKDGKLYLNYSKSVQKKWKAEAPDFIKKADTAWNKID